MSIEALLSKLDKVKSTGKDRWLACCPAHGDKNPSMHIKLDESGRILINCKVGCGTYEILQSIGLEWADVMPNDQGYTKPTNKKLYATEALQLLRYESQIIYMGALSILDKTLSYNDKERIGKAMDIINKIYKDAGL
jgi:hypothetical protein